MPSPKKSLFAGIISILVLAAAFLGWFSLTHPSSQPPVDPSGKEHPLPPGWDVPDSGISWIPQDESWTIPNNQGWSRAGRTWRTVHARYGLAALLDMYEWRASPSYGKLDDPDRLVRCLQDSGRYWSPDTPLLDTAAPLELPGAGKIQWTGQYFWTHADSLWAEAKWQTPTGGGPIEVLLPEGAIDHKGILHDVVPRYLRLAISDGLFLDSGEIRTSLPLVLEGPPGKTIPRVPPQEEDPTGQSFRDLARTLHASKPLQGGLVYASSGRIQAIEGVSWSPRFEVKPATVPESARILSRKSGITFVVDTVSPELSRLPALPDSTLRERMQPELRNQTTRWTAGEWGSAALVSSPWSGHTFLDLFLNAWNEHRPVRLSPDAVWMVLLEGMLATVQAHPRSVRSDMVRHKEGKIPLTAMLDPKFSLRTQSRTAWEEVARQLLDSMDRHAVGNRHKKLERTFSTTTGTRALAMRFRILDIYQEYFEYRGMPMCGIPWIHLEGTPEDWRTLRSAAQEMRTSTNGAWLDGLRPVLDEFVATAEGHPSPLFWSTFVRYSPATRVCGSVPVVDGWIAAFFNTSWSPSLGWPQEEEPIPTHTIVPRIPIDRVPRDHGQVPFVLIEGNRQRPFHLVSGFTGLRQDPDGALAAEIGWSVWETKP